MEADGNLGAGRLNNIKCPKCEIKIMFRILASKFSA